MSSAARPAAEARGPPESAAAPQPAESAAGLQQEVAVAGLQAEYQVEYFATLEVAVRKQHVVSRPRRSSMSPATRPRQSVSSRPRDSVTSPRRPAAAATVAMTEAPLPPPPPPLVSPRARGSPSAPRRVWPASPLMPPKTPDEGRALRANLEQVLSDHNPNPNPSPSPSPSPSSSPNPNPNLEQVLSDHNSRRSSTFASGKPAAVPVAAEEQK